MDGFINEKTFHQLLAGVSKKTIQRWAKDGYGPPRVKIGPRRVGYPVQAVEEFLKSRAPGQRKNSTGSRGDA